MGRIRTIKPEFAVSESIGRLSRDARLLFILLFTYVDDSGRARGNLAIIRGALYPFDDDAVQKIAGWMDELVVENLIVRYEVDGTQYVAIRNWAKHQKIDRPTPSRLPAFDEDSSSPRRALDAGSRILDQGSRILDRGSQDQQTVRASSEDRAPRFVKPTLEEVLNYAKEYSQDGRAEVNVEEWFDHYECNGWRVGRNPMKDWRAALRQWARRQGEFSSPASKSKALEFPTL